MEQHTLYGKRKLCYTEVTDFTDFQGIGRDPLYKRFDSVFSVIEKCIDKKYVDFLAHPIYSSTDDHILWYVRDWNESPCAYKELNEVEKSKYAVIKEAYISEYEKANNNLSGEDRQILSGALKFIDDDFIYCYDDKVVVVAWGMIPDSNKYLVKGAVIHDLKIQNKHKICFDSGNNGSLSDTIAGTMNRPDGFILSQRDLPPIFPHTGYVFKSWEPNPIGMKVDKPLKFTAIYEKSADIVATTKETSPIEEIVYVSFDSGDKGSIVSESPIAISKGEVLPKGMIPDVIPEWGYSFIGWDPSTNMQIYNDTTFTAQYKRKDILCRFVVGKNGTLVGQDTFPVTYGTIIDKDRIPRVNANKGYTFIGWDKSLDSEIKKDIVFTARYERKMPWFKRLWAWFISKGCLKSLLWLLLIILLLFLFSWLFRSCESKEVVVPSDKIETTDGRVIDNNGPVSEIVGEDGKLPNDNIVAPIIGDDGQKPPIIENPGSPDIISNRLNIYFENNNVDLDRFASDLLKIYDEGQCKVIGADRNVPMIQILIPESQRDVIRESLNKQLPDYDFFVVDESIFTTVGVESKDTKDIGWHLKAIKVKEGWKITKGDPNIIVAVIDDGIDPSHELLKGHIVKPYNVFTQDNKLSNGTGHGTHVAGLAVGSDKQYDRGVSGIAPLCKLMPVQVFDNELCTFSSVTSGIMYAIHNGADIVNVSIGPNFRGLDVLPVIDQELIAKTKFRNEEMVWRKIINVANDNNAIIVFAAGNDNIIASIPPENRTNSTINVAAVGKDIRETDFTNYGSGSNISAPGKSIASSVPVNQYAVYDGTSMSAPIVSGAVALLKSISKEVGVTEILHILQATGIYISKYVPPMIQVSDALIALKTGIIPEMPSTTEDAAPVNDDNSQNGISDSDNKTEPETDYDAIRKMIESYKQKISDLEKLLPENKK